jgi:hypothetical protein
VRNLIDPRASTLALIDTGFSEGVMISKDWMEANDLLPFQLDTNDTDLYSMTGQTCSVIGRCNLTFVFEVIGKERTSVAFHAKAYVCSDDMPYQCILGRKIISHWKIDAPRRRIVWRDGTVTKMK